ncbi:DUF4760 domain-containing protein [Anaerotignum sp.]|uniref:DUF4760 domain-containing protein n=1 Tax=Anaerotignum sp. TaxID=2039241 RepID=UPI0028981FEA|nr:hypothetical protein [Anaerotignum sp.]
MAIEIISATIAVVSAIASIIIFFYTQSKSRIVTLKEYHIEDNSDEMFNARKNVYMMDEDEIVDLTTDDRDRALICTHYQFYATLYLNNVIDRDVYNKVFGFAAEKLYTKLEPYIMKRRERDTDNHNLCCEYETMVKKYLRK